VVWVTKGGTKAPKVKEVSTTVAKVFAGSAIPGLTSPRVIAEQLGRLRNVLAELAGLYHVVKTAKPGQAFTLVYDYEGIRRSSMPGNPAYGLGAACSPARIGVNSIATEGGPRATPWTCFSPRRQ